LTVSDNQIAELEADHIKSLSASLETLILAGNCLSSVPEAIFWNLSRLTRLDLSRNNIINIHSMAFQTGLPALSHLHLADNLLGRYLLSNKSFLLMFSIYTVRTIS
jgi:Leucine-rich repeat (LRR) protein